MTYAACCTCPPEGNPRCAVHGSNGPVVPEPPPLLGELPPVPSVSVVVESTAAALLQLLRDHKHCCQLCGDAGFKYESYFRACPTGAVLRAAWYAAHQLLSQPSRWAVVEDLTLYAGGAS